MITENTEENILYVRRSDLLSVECDDDLIVMLESDDDNLVGLNATAKFLWDELESPKTIEQLSSSVSTIYDVDAEQGRSDVIAFLNKMAASGLME